MLQQETEDAETKQVTPAHFLQGFFYSLLCFRVFFVLFCFVLFCLY